MCRLIMVLPLSPQSIGGYITNSPQKEVIVGGEHSCWQWLSEEMSTLLMCTHMHHIYDATKQLLMCALTRCGDMLDPLSQFLKDETVSGSMLNRGCLLIFSKLLEKCLQVKGMSCSLFDGHHLSFTYIQ